MFSTRHAQTFFRVASPQTIRNWAKEFNSYLSPGATPGEGNARRFTMEDMEVLALIAQMSSEGKTFPDIHASLAAGQRSKIPSITPEEMDALVAGEVERQLSGQLHEARQLAQRLEEELSGLKSQMQPLRDENIRLKAQLDERELRINELKQQLEDSQQRITRLAEEKGEAYVKGIMEALNRRGDFSSKE